MKCRYWIHVLLVVANIIVRFVYGGRSGNVDATTASEVAGEDALDEVFVLSLPAFEWFQADYQALNPRFSHTCHIVGNRQLLSIGGINPAITSDSQFNTSDTFKQGLGIFDLTNMVWSDKYDVNAEPYQLPEVVNEWYSNK